MALLALSPGIAVVHAPARLFERMAQRRPLHGARAQPAPRSAADPRIDADIRDIEDIDPVAQPGKARLATAGPVARGRGRDKGGGRGAGPGPAGQGSISVETHGDAA